MTLQIRWRHLAAKNRRRVAASACKLAVWTDSDNRRRRRFRMRAKSIDHYSQVRPRAGKGSPRARTPMKHPLQAWSEPSQTQDRALEISGEPDAHHQTSMDSPECRRGSIEHGPP